MAIGSDIVVMCCSSVVVTVVKAIVVFLTITDPSADAENFVDLKEVLRVIYLSISRIISVAFTYTSLNEVVLLWRSYGLPRYFSR